MKNIKMMGLVEKMRAKIQAARDKEMEAFIGFNWLVMGFNACGRLTLHHYSYPSSFTLIV